MTTPPNAPEVDVLAWIDNEIKQCDGGRPNSIMGRAKRRAEQARTAVSALLTREAALVARNAELEAERDALRTMLQQAEEDIKGRDAVIECKNIDTRERDRAISGWAEKARKLEAENKALRESLRIFTGAAYPVSVEINGRGHAWNEAYLDQALQEANKVLARTSAAPGGDGT